VTKIDWPGIDGKIREGVGHEIHLHPDFFSDLENYNEEREKLMKYISIDDLIKYMTEGRGWMHLDIYDAEGLQGYVEGAIEDGASVIDIPDQNEEGIAEKYTFEQMDDGVKRFVELIQGNELDLGFNGVKTLDDEEYAEYLNKICESLNKVGESFDVSAEDLKYAMNNKGGGNQMNNEIEDSVDIRAKLEQLTEECGELIQASMKLIRALGNGNPTKVSKDEAIAKVLEEWSDVEIAGIYILKMLEGMAGYDIYEKIDEIGKFKEQRWIDRVRKGEVTDEDENDNGEGVSGGCCADGDYCNF